MKNPNPCAIFKESPCFFNISKKLFEDLEKEEAFKFIIDLVSVIPSNVDPEDFEKRIRPYIEKGPLQQIKYFSDESSSLRECSSRESAAWSAESEYLIAIIKAEFS